MIMIGIKDGVVVSCVPIDDPSILSEMYPEQEFVLSDSAITVGWLYVNSSFVPPDTINSTSTSRITQLAFLNRFTDQEAIMIDLASQGMSESAALLRRFQKKADAARYIDLADAATQMGVRTLEAVGLIGAGRADQVLSLDILPNELYVGKE